MPRTTHLRSFFFILLLNINVGTCLPAVSTARCPSSTDIAQWMRNTYHVGSNSVFYSDPVESSDAQKFIDESRINPKGHSWDEMRGDKQIENWKKACGEKKLSARISKAFALSTNAGTHYLLVDEDQPPAATSHWILHEYPTLQRKTGVVIKQIFVEDINWNNMRMTLEVKAHQIWPDSEAHTLPESKADD